MSVTCPHGHSSVTTDYCDACGAPIVGAPEPPGARTESESHEEVDTSPAIRREPCPVCRTPRSGDDRFCEACGHDFVAPPMVWEAVAAPDRLQFERFATPGLTFPEHTSERRFVLSGPAVRIGRSRGRPGESVPEIDLAGDPEDPGISRLHAMLERQRDGSYAVRDLGSTNGTTLNNDPQPIATDAAVALAPGDQIHIGAWTTICLRCSG